MSLDKNCTDEQLQYDKRQLAEMFHRAGLSEIRIMPQGLFSTPLAEVAMPLQGLMSSISAALCALDGEAPTHPSWAGPALWSVELLS